MSENSKLKVVSPVEVTDTVLTSSSVALDDAPLWVAGTYNQDDQVIYDNQVWKVSATSTTDRPDLGAAKEVATWVRMGWANKYRMFNDGVDSKTTDTTPIVVTLQPGQVVSNLAALGSVGTQVNVVVNDPIEGQVLNLTVDLLDIGAPDFWEWHYTPYRYLSDALFDIPPTYPNATITMTVSGITDVSVGRLVMGLATEIGVTNLGTSVSNLSYSGRDRDGFGNLILDKKRTVKLVDYQVTVPTRSVSYVRGLLDSLDNIPTLTSGSSADGYSSATVFGVVQDFRLIYSGHTLSDMTLTMEGF